MTTDRLFLQLSYGKCFPFVTSRNTIHVNVPIMTLYVLDCDYCTCSPCNLATDIFSGLIVFGLDWPLKSPKTIFRHSKNAFVPIKCSDDRGSEKL